MVEAGQSEDKSQWMLQRRKRGWNYLRSVQGQATVDVAAKDKRAELLKVSPGTRHSGCGSEGQGDGTIEGQSRDKPQWMWQRRTRGWNY